MNDLTTLAAQMQNAPGQSLCHAGIRLQKKELDEQIKTQLACLCVSAPVCTGRPDRPRLVLNYE